MLLSINPPPLLPHPPAIRSTAPPLHLPTPAQLDLGGYETWLGTNRVEREASVMITEKILELFGRVR